MQHLTLFRRTRDRAPCAALAVSLAVPLALALLGCGHSSSTSTTPGGGVPFTIEFEQSGWVIYRNVVTEEIVPAVPVPGAGQF